MSNDEPTLPTPGILNDDSRPGSLIVPPEGLSPERAYDLQSEITRLREDRGDRVIGYKVGCTSPAIQGQLGIREPIFGRIFDSGCVPSGTRVRHDRYSNPAIEGELAIRLARDIPFDPLSDDEYVEAVASVFPVIELHHYHLPEVNGLVTLIASGGMHAGFVPSDQETTCSGRIPIVTDLDVAIDGIVVGTTRSPWTMGGPASTLRWLTARLAERRLQLRRGQVILTGSPLALFPVKPGSRVVVKARPLGMTCLDFG